VTTQPLILIVDDFPDALEIASEYLKFKGYRTDTAASGPSAIAKALANPPDLVLMDIRMLGMSGTQAMRELRKDPRFERTPILALTAHALEAERVALLNAGFNGVIPKPCFPDDLANHVAIALGRQAAAVDVEPV
jgi:CheY-like chemotaxis protein